MSLEAIVFDVDGTLAEVEELYRRACNETFADAAVDSAWPDPGRHWQWDRAVYGELMRAGAGEARIAAYARDRLGVRPEPERVTDLHARAQARFAAILAEEGIALRPGIAELAASARDAGLRLAVATSMDAADAHAVLRAGFGADARRMFDPVIGGDDVAQAKPAPDVYVQAVAGLGLPGAVCVALEDSRNGIAAAHAAGLRCVASASLYTADDDLSGADVIVKCFREVADVDALVDALAST